MISADFGRNAGGGLTKVEAAGLPRLDMIKQCKDGVVYFKSEIIPVPNGFSSRVGGVSTGVFTSLNLGSSKFDNKADILENYKRFCCAAGVPADTLVFTKQIHSDIVRIVTRENAGEGFLSPAETECDALVTCDAGVTLTVFTADCVPVLLCDTVAGVIGAAHAGWRGTASGIVSNTVRGMKKLGAKPENIRAAIGPSMGQCCFETDEDVPDALFAALGSQVEPFIKKRGDKWVTDLRGVNALWLSLEGVNTPDISELCTKCEEELFYSHRRDGMPRGTMAAMIGR